MVRVWVIVACVLWFSGVLSPSVMADGLPSPEQVLERARLGRFDFDDVLLDVRREIPYMRDKAQIESYILILDEMKRIEMELNYSIFDTSPLAPVAAMLTKADLRNVSLVNDSDTLLTAFTRWSNDTTRAEFCRTQSASLERGLTREALSRVIARLDGLITMLGDPELAVDVGVISSYDMLQGVAVGALLIGHYDRVTVDDARVAMRGLRAVESISPVLDRLYNATLTAVGSGFPLAMMGYGPVIVERMDRFNPPPTIGARARPGMIVSESMLRVLQAGESIPAELYRPAVEMLDPGQINGAVSKLIGLDLERLPPSRFSFLAELADVILSRLRALDMGSEAGLMDRFRGDMIVARAFDEPSIEGIYDIATSDGRYQLTIARTGVATMAACFARRENGFSLPNSLTYTQYIAESGTIHLSGVDANQSPSAPSNNSFLDLRVTAGGGVEGVFQSGERRVTFAADRQGAYTDFMRRPAMPTPSPVGVYAGFLMGMPATLTINRAGAEYSGMLVFAAGGDSRIPVPLGISYFNPRAGTLYLTDRGLDTGAFLQARGQFVGDRFEGEYIVANRTAAYPFVFNRLTTP